MIFMIHIPQKILLPLVGGLVVLALGAGVYAGRSSAEPPAPAASTPTQSAPAPEASPAAPSSGDIGEAAAKPAALAHAGLTESQITGLRVERDQDEGRLEYEMEFWQGVMEYEYTLDGTSGSILKRKWEDHTAPAPSSGDLGEAAAKAAALAHAGLTESQITGLRVERDQDDGRLEYEIEFWQGTVEYEYTFDGAAGTMLKHEWEDHTAPVRREGGA